MSDYDGEERRGGHDDLGWIKKSVVGLLITLTTHLAAGIWWASSQTTKMDFVQDSLMAMREELKSSNSDRYRGSDATKDLSVINARIDRNEFRLLSMERVVYKIKEDISTK